VPGPVRVFTSLAIVLTVLAHQRGSIDCTLGTRCQSATSGSASTSSIFSRRQTGRAKKSSRKARLRRETLIQGDLSKRQLARCYFRHRVLERQPTDIAVGREADSLCEHPGEMKHTETRDLSQFCQRDLIGKMCGNEIENMADPHLVELMRSGRGEATGSVVRNICE
jgi:hypothetical protein